VQYTLIIPIQDGAICCVSKANSLKTADIIGITINKLFSKHLYAIFQVFAMPQCGWQSINTGHLHQKINNVLGTGKAIGKW